MNNFTQHETRLPRRRAGLAASLVCGLVLLGGSPGLAEPAARPQRFIYNSDADNLFIYQEPPMKPDDLFGSIDEVADAGVTTLFMSPNVGMVMNFPSRYARMLGAEDDEALRQRIAKEGRERSGTLARAAVNLRALVDAGHDPLAIVLARARERRLETFISFRVNEVHGVNTPDKYPYQLIISRFWREHPEWHIGQPGAPLSPLHQQILGPGTSPVVGTWLPGGLDFAVPEVRHRRLDQLRECCERYDIDGLDLDFQRFPVFFKYGQEQQHLATMTAWMGEVRAMTRQVASKRGRPLLLSARIMARPEQNLALGLDPVRWARDGLVDFVVVSHYLHNDFSLPIKQYRPLLPERMPLYASIEVEPKADNYRRLAAELYRAGVDGIMMFNFFTVRQSGREPDFAVLKELGQPARYLDER